MNNTTSTSGENATPGAAWPDQDDLGTDWSNTGGPAGGEGAESTDWTSSGSRWSSAGASASAHSWLSQLESIIENLATQSAPVIREVGAKAAEIAALAAERAGPLAIRAADATAQATVKVAERSRSLAAEWRRHAGDAGEAGNGDRGTGADADGTAAP